MKNAAIVFTAPGHAELQVTDDFVLPVPGEREVLVRMLYTVVSGGTERANLLGAPNTNAHFPMSLGYCGIGIVKAVGSRTEHTAVGDRVLVYHGIHALYNLRGEEDITKVGYPDIPSEEAALTVIASMGLGGVRKTELELGESAMVIGLGLLGIFAVQFLRLSGAYPLIVSDTNPERRALALSLGADHAFDPSDPDFVNNVKSVTGGKGVAATVEVTGASAALSQALDCASYMGRIVLLGCTRVSDTAVDYYKQIHKPGVKLIGAHNFVRPKYESYPHHWTHQDDCRCILDLLAAGRLKAAPIIHDIVSPLQAENVYDRLCSDPDFPIGTIFDWKNYQEDEE